MPLMSVIFSAAKSLYNIRGLFVIFKCPAGVLGTCSRFFINGHNALFYFIKGKWYYRRHLHKISGPGEVIVDPWAGVDQ